MSSQNNVDNKNWIIEPDYAILNKMIYSQYNQDGILEYIFSKINMSNKPYCVEFGCNNLNLFSRKNANIANLIKKYNFNYIQFDGKYEKKEINLYKEYLTSDNIVHTFKKYNIPLDVDYVSIDVDSIDLWLFDALLKEYKPKVISCEYNCSFPLDYAISCTNEPFEWQCNRRHGASLKSLDLIGKLYNYSLCFVAGPQDGFFIRNDLIKGCKIPELKSFTKVWGFSNKGPPPVKNISLINKFIDIEHYLKTKNKEESIKKAEPIVRKYIYNIH